MNIKTQLKFGDILFGCLAQVGCLIEVTANSGLTVYNSVYLTVCLLKGYEHDEVYWFEQKTILGMFFWTKWNARFQKSNKL